MLPVHMLVVQFDYRGCSAQHHSLLPLYNLEQYNTSVKES